MMAGVCLQTFQYILIFTFTKLYWISSDVLMSKQICSCHVFNSSYVKLGKRTVVFLFLDHVPMQLSNGLTVSLFVTVPQLL